MPSPIELLDNNRRWAQAQIASDPEYFSRLAAQQKPQYLWIGCADSRVPANQIIGLPPGEVFVHRNVANLVVHSDLNCLSVLHFAVEVLQVKHIIVCGHYGCGGVLAALKGGRHGLIDNWLRHIKDVYHEHRAEVDGIQDPTLRGQRMCEINVEAQVANVCYTTIVQDAWARGQQLSIHGWVYALQDGLIREVDTAIDSLDDLPEAYRLD